MSPSSGRARLALGAAAVALGAAGALAQEGPEVVAIEPIELVRPAGFVATDGTRFVVDGEPFRFVGANVGVMHGPVHRAAMEATLDAAVEDHLAVVRLWALGEYDPDAPTWADDYAFRRGPDGWLEPSLAHLDRALAACAARGLRAIVVLGNRWADYGGIGTYLRWALVPFEVEAGGAVATSHLSRFYESLDAERFYRSHVGRVVGRISGVTGVPYRDDPTILAWELVNELEAPRRSAASLVRWVEAQASYVRSLDPYHLVSAGHVGYATRSERRTWREVAGADGIDFVDAHAYPTRYGEVTSLEDLARWVDDRAQLAHHVIHRPLVFGEVGFSATEARVLDLPRRRWLDAFLRAASRDGVAGVLSWIYVPDGDVPMEHAILTTGDDVERTRDLRDVLSRHARRWARSAPAEHNPRLGDDVGEAPIWDPSPTVRGDGGIHDDWTDEGPSTRLLSFDPAGFDRARFERAGAEDGAPVVHLWATGAGWIRYRFRAPRRGGTPVRFSLAMRASSELPGAGVGATADDVSRVRVSIDDVPAGVIALPPDDGIGRVVTLEITDPTILAALADARRHVLELEVDEDALGICLYGEPGRDAASLDEAVLAELPGRIELRWTE